MIIEVWRGNNNQVDGQINGARDGERNVKVGEICKEEGGHDKKRGRGLVLWTKEAG